MEFPFGTGHAVTAHLAQLRTPQPVNVSERRIQHILLVVLSVVTARLGHLRVVQLCR